MSVSFCLNAKRSLALFADWKNWWVPSRAKIYRDWWLAPFLFCLLQSGEHGAGWVRAGFWPRIRMTSAGKNSSFTDSFSSDGFMSTQTPLDSWHIFEQSGLIVRLPNSRTKKLVEKGRFVACAARCIKNTASWGEERLFRYTNIPSWNDFPADRFVMRASLGR